MGVWDVHGPSLQSDNNKNNNVRWESSDPYIPHLCATNVDKQNKKGKIKNKGFPIWPLTLRWGTPDTAEEWKKMGDAVVMYNLTV